MKRSAARRALRTVSVRDRLAFVLLLLPEALDLQPGRDFR
jgi:hypothetical protein